LEHKGLRGQPKRRTPKRTPFRQGCQNALTIPSVSRHYTPSLATADFWQHNVMVGYRFAHRHAEIRAAILNVADTDYRLNPLNLQRELPRGRTFVGSLRLNF
jgi:outer membrane receptor protein involved in Fe transport